jgi:hypothetical protein
MVNAITQATNELNRLTGLVPAYNNALVELYSEGNTANNRVQSAKDVYEALSNKFTLSIQHLNETKIALEKAREESMVADMAVN